MSGAVYLETTIPSYLAARPSRDLIRATHQRADRGMVADAPGSVRPVRFRTGAPRGRAWRYRGGAATAGYLAGIASLAITPATQALASTFLEAGLRAAKAAVDALPIAIASAHGVDYLLTWNIRHLGIQW